LAREGARVVINGRNPRARQGSCRTHPHGIARRGSYGSPRRSRRRRKESLNWSIKCPVRISS
jgi:hypothetical protein